MPDAPSFDVRRVAELARIELSDEEAVTYQGQLDAVLEHLDHLAQVDVEGVEPTAYPTPVSNVLRKDETRDGLTREAALGNAPREAKGQFQVPKVIEKV